MKRFICIFATLVITSCLAKENNHSQTAGEFTPYGVNYKPLAGRDLLFIQMNYENEIWKDIPGWVGYYQASNIGRIKSLKRSLKNSLGRIYTYPEIIRKCRSDKDGYLVLSMWRNGKCKKNWRVHRLVLAAFLGESGLMVDHIDGDVTNNRIENLRYCTNRENQSFENCAVKATKKSKYVGVVRVKKLNRSKPWRARIFIKKKCLHLGYHETEEMASVAYQNKLSELKLSGIII